VYFYCVWSHICDSCWLSWCSAGTFGALL